jgi:hypothetical protein
MADYFGTRYWADRYFPPAYYQGGEVDPNAMSASLSGAATLTASISYTSVAGGGAIVNLERRRRRKKKWLEAIERLQDGEKLPLPAVKKAITAATRAATKPTLAEAAKAESTADNYLKAVKSRGIDSAELAAALDELRKLQARIERLRIQEEEELMVILALAA